MKYLYCKHCGDEVGNELFFYGKQMDDGSLRCKKCSNKKIKIEEEGIDSRFEILDL